MTARGNFGERWVPVIAVGLGLGHAAFLGGLATPVTFSRAVLAVGILCPLMMGMNSARIGHMMLRPQPRQLLPFLVGIALGPALALIIARHLLQRHPEQAITLLLLSFLPGSALAPLWASATRASGSTAIALVLTGWSMVTLVSLLLFSGSFASVVSLVALRDLAFLGAIPLVVGGACRVALTEALEPEYARNVEPLRQTVLQASLAVLLFTSAADEDVAAVLRGGVTMLPALIAVLLLYLGLVVGCGAMILLIRKRREGSSRAATRATLLASTTRQTALAVSVLPLVVAPPALQSALAVPVSALILELLVGVAALALLGPWTQTATTAGTSNREGRPSIVPE